MITWILKELEKNPTSVFHKQDLLKKSEQQFEELKRIGLLTYVQPDLNCETYPCSLPCANTCPMDIAEVGGKLFAICPKNSEIDPIPLDRDDLDKYAFCIEKFLEQVRLANGLSGVLHKINQDFFYFGYATYKSNRVGFVFGFTIIHKSVLELTGLKHLCTDDDYLIVFSPVSMIEDISRKRDLDRERVVQTSFASSLNFQTYEFSIENLLSGAIAREVEKEQKTKPEKYIKLAEQIASNLEDWANPKAETGLRYEYVGHLKPISIALEGFDELLDWLNLNKAEEGKFVQAAYDKLVSRAKLDDHLLEGCYEGDEIFSEECAVDLADTLRVVAKMAEGVFVEDPTVMSPEAEFGQGTGDEWITVSGAAKLLAVNRGVVSRWASEGRIKDNGETGRKRRVLKSSVLLMKHKREHEDLIKDATEDLQDIANKIPDRH